MNCYGISECYRPLPGLDSWLRRRRCRTRVRALIRLGAPEKHAVLAGLSRTAYWHSARTLGTQSGMTDRWLAAQGLLSVRELWIAVHYPPDQRRVGQ